MEEHVENANNASQRIFHSEYDAAAERAKVCENEVKRLTEQWQQSEPNTENKRLYQSLLNSAIRREELALEELKIAKVLDLLLFVPVSIQTTD